MCCFFVHKCKKLCVTITYIHKKNGFNSSKLTNVIGKRNHYGTFAEKTETHTRGTSTASYFTMTFEM